MQEIRTSLGSLHDHVETLNASFEDMKSRLTGMENKIKEIESAATHDASSAGPSSKFKDTKHPKQCGYLVAGGDENDTVEVFDKILNSWIEVKPMTLSRSGASSVFYKGSVLVTGGTSKDKRVTSSIEQFSFNTSPFIPLSWSDLAVKLPRPLQGHCTVLYKNRLIVLGGDDGNEFSDFTYEVQLQFPFNTNILAELPPRRVMRACGAVLVNNKIFIFGGGRGYLVTAKVTMYDITKNEFKELKPLPYEVCNMATVKNGENVILAGGSSRYGFSSNSKNTVISYNIKTQKSTELPKMKKKRSECCAVVDGNSLVVMGGDGSYFDTPSSVEVFDFKTSTWSDLPSMINPRKAFIAEIV